MMPVWSAFIASSIDWYSCGSQDLNLIFAGCREFFEFVEAGGALADMVEDGVGPHGARLSRQPRESGRSWTADAFGVGMLMVN